MEEERKKHIDGGNYKEEFSFTVKYGRNVTLLDTLSPQMVRFLLKLMSFSHCFVKIFTFFFSGILRIPN